MNRQVSLPVGDMLIGRVLDPLGRPKDGKGVIDSSLYRPLEGTAPNPMLRQRIDKNVETGVRVIDGLLSLGEGQRIAIMAGSGVGKSTLMGMLARNSSADVNVIALVGERGREVREFIEKNDLQEEGMRKSVVVVSTSDVTPALQIKGMQSTITIAEYFRDQGKSVFVDDGFDYSFGYGTTSIGFGEKLVNLLQQKAILHPFLLCYQSCFRESRLW